MALVVPNAHAQDAQAPVPIGAPAPASDATEPTAKELYVLRRYVEAARAFEAMHTPGSIYNAGMARAAAGHDAHALQRWARYLEFAPEDERAEVQQRMNELRKLTVDVHFVRSAEPDGSRTLVLRAERHIEADDLRVTWPEGQASVSVALDPGAWSVTLEGEDEPRKCSVVVTKETALKAVDLAPPPVPVSVQLRIAPARARHRGVEVAWTGPRQAAERRVVKEVRTRWELRPGSWQLEARAPGYVPLARAVEVKGGPVDIAVELKRERADWSRLGLGVGLGVVGVGLAATGGGLLGVGLTAERHAPDADGRVEPLDSDRDAVLTRALRQQAAGVGLLSAAGGAAVVALTAGLTRRRRALAAEAGLGAALGIVGAVLYLRGSGCPDRYRAAATDPEHFELSRAQVRGCASKGLPGELLMGVGTGLLASVIALIAKSVQRRNGRRSAVDVSANLSNAFIQGGF